MINYQRKTIIAFLILVAVGLGIFAFYYQKKISQLTAPKKPQISEEERLIKEQLKELDKLKEFSQTERTQNQTTSTPKTQLQELKTLKKKSKPLSQEEIQTQLEELEELKKYPQ